MKPRVRLGIVGCGRVAVERHLPALRRVADVQIVAVADIDTNRARRFADLTGAGHSAADYRVLLERPDLDAIAVLTPTSSHAEIAAAAMEAGKHVLLEKPLAMTLSECDRLIDAEKRSRSRILVGFNLRWHRLVREARRLLDNQVLGTVRAVRSTYTHNRRGIEPPAWHQKLALGGGVSLNEGVHHYDLWRLLLGSEVQQVFATSISSPQYEDESSTVVATLANGCTATGIFSLQSSPNSALELYGESGRLCLSLYRFDGLTYYPDSVYPGDLGHRLKSAASAFAKLPGALPQLVQGGDFSATFHGLWRHFVDCIRYDRPSECSLADGKRALEIALAGMKSATSGQPVRLTWEQPE